MKTDLSYLQNMTDGNMELIQEMIDIFISQVKEYGQKMKQLFKEKKWMELSKLAHKAKASVAIMGMSELSEELKELEIMAKEKKHINKYHDFIHKFINDCDEAVKELKRFTF